MKFGIDRLLTDPELRGPLAGKRVALVAHPASVTENLVHSLDALMALDELNVTAAFGPQHGLKGDKQDNMVETADETDPLYGIPVFSLYGEVRRPTGQMMSTADVFLFDLQDLGCRIYTFVTTLLYLLEAASGTGKAVWVLDRPNPAGRPVEGDVARTWPGELRRRGADADAARADTRRNGALVRRAFQARRRLPGDRDGGLGARRPRLRLAGKPHLDQSEPQCREPQHGARLCRNGDARRHHLERGQGHDPSARSAVRRARRRCGGGAHLHGTHRAALARRLRDPRMLVHPRPSTSMPAPCATR